MLPLQYGRAWLAAGGVILIVALSLALLPNNGGVPVLYSDKVTHGLAFLVLMTWFTGIYRFRLAPAVALGLVAYGVLIEVLQGYTSTRQADVGDVVADATGILLGWLLCAAGLRHWCSRVESWLVTRQSR